ncbi:MAG: cytochrome c3 family protein [Vicinamibacterales bacterium]|jgi:predicted CXXCH cytochrome family protein
MGLSLAKRFASRAGAGARLSGAVLLLLTARHTSAQEAAACLECHALPDQELSFRSGEKRSISLDPKAWEASAHGASGLDCNACHAEHGEYPHAEIKDGGSREYAAVRTAVCESCHEDQAKKFTDGVHFAMRQAGHPEAAVCTDCHDPHAGKRLTDPERGTLLPEARIAVPRTCARCHEAIYDQYQASAHGAALFGEGNPDVPTCIDCHGVHQISDPRTARFRVNSPKICAGCHTDAAKMARYGLSTSVLKTYVADFHGSTVTLFQKSRPDQATNKPVCYDCHGVHDIPHTDDPAKGIKTKANLLRTCQQCHPDATANFPDAWMSHFVPDREKAPLVFWVNWFYRLLIPGTLGGMLLFVGADFARRRSDRKRSRREHAPAPSERDTETPS